MLPLLLLIPASLAAHLQRIDLPELEYPGTFKGCSEGSQIKSFFLTVNRFKQLIPIVFSIWVSFEGSFWRSTHSTIKLKIFTRPGWLKICNLKVGCQQETIKTCSFHFWQHQPVLNNGRGCLQWWHTGRLLPWHKCDKARKEGRVRPSTRKSLEMDPQIWNGQLKLISNQWNTNKDIQIKLQQELTQDFSKDHDDHHHHYCHCHDH